MIIFALIQTLSALGINTVNTVDINGDACPAFTRLNQKCPVVCVSAISECPIQVRPSDCPSGQFYCSDGICHSGNSFETACSQTVSRCLCKFGFLNGNGDGLLPCNAGLYVNVTDPSQNVNPGNIVVKQCATTLGLTYGSKTAPFLTQCRIESLEELTFKEPAFIAFYCYLMGQLALLYFWSSFKSKQSLISLADIQNAKKLGTSIFNECIEMSSVEFVSNNINSNANPSKKDKNLTFAGYRKDSFGSAVQRSLVITSMIWIFLFLLVTLDYYELFAGAVPYPYTMLFMDHDNLSRIFIVVWHLSAIWFVCLQTSSAFLLTSFLIKTPVSYSPDYILISKYVEPEVIQNQSLGKLVELVHAIERPFRKLMRMNQKRTLVEVKYMDKRTPFVEFECIRYVFDSALGSFEPFDFHLGSTNEEIHARSNGLSSNEAARRLNMNGPNQILFERDDFFTALLREFSGIFYLYQSLMLVIWWYYSYYYMAFVLTSVIVASGVIKIIVAQDSQRRVVDMVTYQSRVRVLRGGLWVEIDSFNLVPGDVIEVQSSTEYTLSADCAIISGDVVMDEASLTGTRLISYFR